MINKKIIFTSLTVICISNCNIVSAEDKVSNESYFPSNQIEKWERDILEKADRDIPVGDIKANDGKIFRSSTGL